MLAQQVDSPRGADDVSRFVAEALPEARRDRFEKAHEMSLFL
jgi:hypothetical protein